MSEDVEQEHSELYRVINKLTTLGTHGSFEKEVEAAHAEFFAKTGKISEEDQSFEPRMALFLEWFLVDRKLDGREVSPLEHLIQRGHPELSEGDLAILKEIQGCQHSIFEFLKAKGHIIYILDFSTRKKLQVYERRGSSGFLKGAIFEARLIPYRKTWYFSGPMLFHPSSAKKFIRKFFKENTISQLDKIFKLSELCLKYDRYKHVPTEKIYCKS